MIPELLDWYARKRRDLPWRRETTPWRVLVAETMLQQTRIAAVVPRYETFLERFPDPAAMAAAGEEEVLALWSGLGYYRRAKSLHAAARAIVAEHGGAVPDESRALRALPGVGAYTSGAVLSIAYGLPEPIVDGNVERVFARQHLLRGNVKRGATRKRLWALAAEAVRQGPPAKVNQALMELGALVCLPRAPRCGDCPVARTCRARAEGIAEELPELPEKHPPVDVVLAVALVRRGDAVLLARAPEGDFLTGTWAPPFARVKPGAEPAAALAAGVASRYGLDLLPGAELGTFRHGITHHRIQARCFGAELSSGPGPDALFADREARGGLGLSSLAAKTLALLP